MKKTSDEEIKSLCESKGLKLLNRFVKNSQTYLTCVCDKHYEPYQFEISFRNLRNLKKSCPKCSGKNMNTKDIKYRVESELKVPVEIIGNYVNMRTPIKTRCKKCGREWDANVVSLCQGSGCDKCKKSKPKKTHEKFIEEMSLVQPNLIITSIYAGDAKEVSYKCKIDNYEGVTTAGRLLSKMTQCTCCVKKKLHDTQILPYEEFEKRLSKINPDITILSGYDGYESKVTLMCNKHNKIYIQRAGDALKGNCGCSQCVSSKGENKVEKILQENSIDYIKQYKFDDCRDIKPLPFDFYIPSLNIAIEYQGQQHYSPVNFGGCSDEVALKNFENQRRRDEIKFQYCQNNKIKLLLIPYTEFDNLSKIIKEKCVK